MLYFNHLDISITFYHKTKDKEITDYNKNHIV